MHWQVDTELAQFDAFCPLSSYFFNPKNLSFLFCRISFCRLRGHRLQSQKKRKKIKQELNIGRAKEQNQNQNNI